MGPKKVSPVTHLEDNKAMYCVQLCGGNAAQITVGCVVNVFFPSMHLFEDGLLSHLTRTFSTVFLRCCECTIYLRTEPALRLYK